MTRVLCCVLGLSLLCVLVSAQSSRPYATWSSVNMAAFPPRASAISAYWPVTPAQPGGRWLVFGGFTRNNFSQTTLSDAWVSADQGATWAQLNSTPFERCEMAADILQTSQGLTLFVSGGVDFQRYLSYNDVYRSDDQGLTFKSLGNTTWTPRTAHAMVTMMTGTSTPTPFLVVLGGYSYTHSYVSFLNDVWTSHDEGLSWAKMPTAGWSGRGDAGVVVVPNTGRVIVAGGFSGWHYTNDVWSSDATLTTWTQVTPAAVWSARWGSVFETFNNSLVLIGGDDGYQNPKHNDVWVSLDFGASWGLSVANATFGGRSDAVAEVIGQYLYIAGGEDNDHTANHVDGQVWRSQIDFTPDVPVTPLPSPPPQPPQAPDDPNKPKTVVIVVVVIAVLAVLCGIGAYIFKYRNQSRPRVPQESDYHLQV